MPFLNESRRGSWPSFVQFQGPAPDGGSIVMAADLIERVSVVCRVSRESGPVGYIVLPVSSASRAGKILMIVFAPLLHRPVFNQ